MPLFLTIRLFAIEQTGKLQTTFAVRKNGMAILGSAKPYGLRVGKPAARGCAIQWDCRNEAECPLLAKAKNAKAFPLWSMRNEAPFLKERVARQPKAGGG